MSECPVCGNAVVRGRRYCSVACRNNAKLERKRIKHNTDPEARERQLIRLKARKITERKPCSRCGAEKAEKHHPDYRYPYIVTWLCRKCHLAHHRDLDARRVIEGVLQPGS